MYAHGINNLRQTQENDDLNVIAKKQEKQRRRGRGKRNV
jgi:hypothetical protein